MTQEAIDSVRDLLNAQRYREALHILKSEIDKDPSGWNPWYLAGQCCRFLNDTNGAIDYLSHAAELKDDELSVFLALGIAFQLDRQWEKAIKTLKRAIEIDPDYELAYNSLALTQKKAGELDKALHNYDAGAIALFRRIVKAMRNSRNNPILKHRETVGTLWLEYAMHTAIGMEGVGSIAWPNGALAMEEERSEMHAGLYWTDTSNERREIERLFLPNYFNTIREQLKRNTTYSNLIGNRGTVLELLERHEEARLHFDEATEFLP